MRGIDRIGDPGRLPLDAKDSNGLWSVMIVCFRLWIQPVDATV